MSSAHKNFDTKMNFDKLYHLLEEDRKHSAWSRQNSFHDRWKELFSEVKEIKDALNNQDHENLKEELGDALLDLLFLMVMAEEKDMFTPDEVVEEVISKLKRRKPWIFGTDSPESITVEEEVRRWVEIKKKEKNL